MGVMRLSKNYSSDIMERASQEALDKNICSYKYFSIILKQTTAKAAKNATEKIIKHNNVRGISAYTGGGINA
jgi:hypothetical protein